MWLLNYVKYNSKNEKIVQTLVTKSLIQDIQKEKKKFKETGKYRLGKLEIRTKEGFEYKKMLS